MKEIIALLILVCMTIFTFYLIVSRGINWQIASVCFVSAIVIPFMVVKYDDIKRIKWGEAEIETAKKELSDLKDKTIAEIESEVTSQKESIRLLISNANETSAKLSSQQEILNGLIETVKMLQDNVQGQIVAARTLADSTTRTKADIERLNLAANKLSLLTIKSNYLTLETRNEFGTERAKVAIEEVIKDLNEILPLAIPNEKERAKWVGELKAKLPSKK